MKSSVMHKAVALPLLLLAPLLETTHAFAVFTPPRSQTVASTRLFSSPTTSSSAVDYAKQDLISTAERLKHDYGALLIDKTAKEELNVVVEELEKLAPPTPSENWVDQYLGDWTLVCTTAPSVQGIDTSHIPFWNQGPLKEIRASVQNAVNKYVRVTQRVRSTNDDGVIDRIDHVIENTTPDELRDVLDNLPEQLSNININPLQVSQSKLVLVHKATVDPITLKTNINLQSVVLNVAGRSTRLDPNGKDIASINIPQLTEFLNAGDFETTYLDDDVRISRGKRGFLDQLRIFVRADRFDRDEALQDIKDKGATVGVGVDAEVDVDDVVDPEFEKDTDEEEGGDDSAPEADLTPSA